MVSLTTLVIVCAAWLSQPPQHALLDKAVPIPGVRLGYQADQYQWLSADELLVFRPVGDLHWVVCRRDVGTGAETPMPPLERLLRQTGGSPSSIKISPDRRRLLWAGIGKWIYGATMDGGEFQQWAYGPEEDGDSYWLNDSRRFVRYSKDRFADPTPIVLRDIAAPRPVQRLPLHWRQDSITREQVTALLAAQRPPTSIYAEGGSCGTDQRDAYVRVCLLGPTGVREETANVPLPLDFFRDERSNPYYVSDGQKMIWTLSKPEVSHQPGWVQRLLAHLRGHSKPLNTIGAYVSRADGLGWQFIGDWEEPAELPYYEQQGESAPGNFRWIPGGKRISFEYHGGLYTVPAD